MFPPRQPEPPKEQKVDPPEDADLERKLSLLEQTVAWRAIQLLDMKFTIEQVLVLVKTPDIAHQAGDLIEAGCPPDVAFDILV